MEDTGCHLLSCKFGGGPIWCHESIAEVWADCLRELRLPCRKEPRHRYSNSEDRPNIVSLDSSSGLGIDLDISLAHPWSGEVFPSSAKIDCPAAKCREEKKNSKYKGQRLPDGEQVILKPLILEHFGRWGEEGKISSVTRFAFTG